MQISKTDFMEYLDCKKNLWLKKHKPELFEGISLSEFEQILIDEGQLVDTASQELFPRGIMVAPFDPESIGKTKSLIDDRTEVILQGSFLWEGFFTRADILCYNQQLNGWELYEVKSSTSVKKSGPHNHMDDLTFQKLVLNGLGLNIIKVAVLHLNSDYIRSGAIQYHDLFITSDITSQVEDNTDKVSTEMSSIRTYMALPEQAGCDCLYRGRSRHCATFGYSNPQVPEYSVHDIKVIGNSKKLLNEWIEKEIYRLDEIDHPEKLSPPRLLQFQSYMTNTPVVNVQAISDFIREIEYPIHFLDYETYNSALPLWNGFGPWHQIPFQYSLHILENTQIIEHREFLETNPETKSTDALVNQLVTDIKSTGSILTWHASFEKGINTRLAQLHPELQEILEDINDRIIDLEDVFSKNYYVDSRFQGKSSLKSVLPVVVPDTTYTSLGIQKGDQALAQWKNMMAATTSVADRNQIANDLREYCSLDTLAMVKIYQFLWGLLPDSEITKSHAP